MARDEVLVSRLRQAGERLPRGVADTDQWRSIWMMLVGAWYLLERATPYLVEAERLDLDAAERFASRLLADNVPAEAQWLMVFGQHPWISGFYVLSAEHRVANSIDRLTKVFAGAKVGDIPDGNKTAPYPRCAYLASECPHCRSAAYGQHVPMGREILQAFCDARDDEPWPALRLARVYKRVNELKHQPEPNRSRDSTTERAADASRALLEVTTVLSELALHRMNCLEFVPLTT